MSNLLLGLQACSTILFLYFWSLLFHCCQKFIFLIFLTLSLSRTYSGCTPTVLWIKGTVALGIITLLVVKGRTVLVTSWPFPTWLDCCWIGIVMVGKTVVWTWGSAILTVSNELYPLLLTFLVLMFMLETSWPIFWFYYNVIIALFFYFPI